MSGGRKLAAKGAERGRVDGNWACKLVYRLQYSRDISISPCLSTLRLAATPGAPAEPPVRPSTQGMLTIYFAAAASPVLHGLPAGQRG